MKSICYYNFKLPGTAKFSNHMTYFRLKYPKNEIVFMHGNCGHLREPEWAVRMISPYEKMIVIQNNFDEMALKLFREKRLVDIMVVPEVEVARFVERAQKWAQNEKNDYPGMGLD